MTTNKKTIQTQAKGQEAINYPGIAAAQAAKAAQKAELDALYGPSAAFSATIPSKTLDKLKTAAAKDFRTLAQQLTYLIETTYGEG